MGRGVLGTDVRKVSHFSRMELLKEMPDPTAMVAAEKSKVIREREDMYVEELRDILAELVVWSKRYPNHLPRSKTYRRRWTSSVSRQIRCEVSDQTHPCDPYGNSFRIQLFDDDPSEFKEELLRSLQVGNAAKFTRSTEDGWITIHAPQMVFDIKDSELKISQRVREKDAEDKVKATLIYQQNKTAEMVNNFPLNPFVILLIILLLGVGGHCFISVYVVSLLSPHIPLLICGVAASVYATVHKLAYQTPVSDTLDAIKYKLLRTFQ